MVTEIYLTAGADVLANVLTVDTPFAEMTEIVAAARKQGVLVNVFDTQSRKRHAFFSEAIAWLAESSEK